MPYALLKVLSDGEFHSGAELAERFGVSRTAIWKRVNRLDSEYNIKVNSVRGKGYRMVAPMRLLDKIAILNGLTPAARQLLQDVDVQSVVGSTNDLAKQRRDDSEPYVCLAESQTAGRGRRGRSWVSPFGKNLYLSLRWQFSEGAAVHHGLSLCVGIALARTIQRAGLPDVLIKWPNDLLYQGRKLAGILLEAVGELNGEVAVIIGIGVNVDMAEEEGAAIEQQWSTLSQELGKSVDRNWLAAELLNELVAVLTQFQQQGFQYFRQEWHRFDALYEKKIELAVMGDLLEGIAKGVNATGALILERPGGRSVHDSGEVSARLK